MDHTVIKLTSKFLNRSGWITYEDYRQMIAEGQKADLIDGVIYMASPDNTDANELSIWLTCLFHEFLSTDDLGKVFASRVSMRLDEKNAPEPDLAIVLADQLERVERRHIDGPADVVVEIVSPESVQRDYEKKRKLYERFGVREYWIIDEDLQALTLLSLRSKSYREVKIRSGWYHSSVLPGFRLNPKWLWATQRPRIWECLQLMNPGR